MRREECSEKCSRPASHTHMPVYIFLYHVGPTRTFVSFVIKSSETKSASNTPAVPIKFIGLGERFPVKLFDRRGHVNPSNRRD